MEKEVVAVVREAVSPMKYITTCGAASLAELSTLAKADKVAYAGIRADALAEMAFLGIPATVTK